MLESEKPAAYSFIRAVSKLRYPVVAASSESLTVSGHSRYIAASRKYPSIDYKVEEFYGWLLRTVQDNNMLTIVSFSDKTSQILSENKTELEEYTRIYQPAFSEMRKVLDKNLTYELARKNGIPVPANFPIDIRNIENDYESFKYPLVIKPLRKFEWIDGKARYFKVSEENYIWNKNEFHRKFFSYYKKNQNIELQEYVKGPGRGYFSIIQNGESLIDYAHERIREFPVSGGASTCRKSIDYKILKELSLPMLKDLAWYGPIMFEYRYSEAEKKHYLMEINGRFWGSLPLAVNNGVNFPEALVRLITGDAIPDYEYRRGFVSRQLIPGDLLWLFSQLLHLNFRSLPDFFRKAGSEDIFDKHDKFAYFAYIMSQFLMIKKVFLLR